MVRAGGQPTHAPTVRVGSAAVTLSGRVWRMIMTALRLPMELLSLASFKAQQVHSRWGFGKALQSISAVAGSSKSQQVHSQWD